MSKTTELLEAAVANVIGNRPAGDERPTPRQRAAVDHAFQTVMKLIAPRIRHFIRQYGLTAHWEDARQACAIGVHRAIGAYDPEKAMFTTFVNWQIRGELQALRFRLMEDQRPSAKKVYATTVSLHGFEPGADGEDMALETIIEDENALFGTEARASDHLAERTCDALMNVYVRHLRSIGLSQLNRKAATGADADRPRRRPRRFAAGKDAPARRPDPEELRKLDERIARDCEIVRRHLFGDEGDAQESAEPGLTKERIRQITRRAARVMGELAFDNPRFAMIERRRDPHGEAPEPDLGSFFPVPATGSMRH